MQYDIRTNNICTVSIKTCDYSDLSNSDSADEKKIEI